jgi:hypothetical protein
MDDKNNVRSNLTNIRLVAFCYIVSDWCQYYTYRENLVQLYSRNRHAKKEELDTDTKNE